MKKRNLKSLALNKKQISTLNGGAYDPNISTLITAFITNDSCNTDGNDTNCLPSECPTSCASKHLDCGSRHCPKK